MEDDARLETYLNEHEHLIEEKVIKKSVLISNLKSCIKFLFLSLVILFLIISITGRRRKILNSICLCTIVKKENNYIREFV